MAVGLNAIRELCARCPLMMSEDLLRDLSEYKTYKVSKMMNDFRLLGIRNVLSQCLPVLVS